MKQCKKLAAVNAFINKKSNPDNNYNDVKWL